MYVRCCFPHDSREKHEGVYRRQMPWKSNGLGSRTCATAQTTAVSSSRTYSSIEYKTNYIVVRLGAGMQAKRTARHSTQLHANDKPANKFCVVTDGGRFGLNVDYSFENTPSPPLRCERAVWYHRSHRHNGGIVRQPDPENVGNTYGMITCFDCDFFVCPLPKPSLPGAAVHWRHHPDNFATVIQS